MDENSMGMEQEVTQTQPVELKKQEVAVSEQPMQEQQAEPQQVPPMQEQQEEPQQVPPMQEQQEEPQQVPSMQVQQQMPPVSVMSPEETQFFSGGIDEINVMVEDVVRRDNLTNEIKNIINEGKRLERELEEEKRNLAKDITDTVNAEMAKTVAEEERIISESNSKLKQIRSDRSKAKEKLPSYCDTKWFYTLYCTQSGLEWLIKIVVFLCGIVFIPGAVCAIVNPWWFLKIILWAVVMVVCIMVYMTIYLLTKDRDNGVLEEMREHRDKISDNDKKIRSVKRGIRTDTDESQYHLEEFDEQIAEYERNFDTAMKLKKQKLGDFELNRKQSVIDEVNRKHMPVIEAKQNEINEKLSLYNQKNNELNELQQKIAERYERFLSKPYTNAACLQRMSEMIQSGSVSNIGQAFMLVKR